MPQGTLWEVAAGCFGVAAAILVVGGWVMLRFQRERQHFLLMNVALERGLTAMPGMIPGWLVSLRQGVLALVLGLGLMATGAVLHRSALGIEAAPAETHPAGPVNEAAQNRPPPPDDRIGGADARNQGPRENGPPDRMGEAPPLRQSPAMERWHQVQTRRLTGVVALCAGGILALLGIVRIVFAKTEKIYAAEIKAAAGSVTP